MKKNPNKTAKRYFQSEYEWLLDTFQNSNVVVFGKKGAGKDVLFALVIYLMDGLHYANMPYNDKTLLLKSLKQLDVGGNDFNNLVQGNIKKYDDPFIKGLPIFISDGAVYFGSQFDGEINKAYSGVATFMALSRQLGEHQIHVNTQALTRLYKKIREQSDAFIRCLRTQDCGRFLMVDAISYDRIQSADGGILPPPDGTSSRELLEFEGRNGEVKMHTFYIEKSWLHFDTHYFARLFLNDSPEIPMVYPNKNFWR